MDIKEALIATCHEPVTSKKGIFGAKSLSLALHASVVSRGITQKKGTEWKDEVKDVVCVYGPKGGIKKAIFNVTFRRRMLLILKR